MSTAKLKVLVVGGGGREHALAWRIARSDLVAAVLCAPGNGGTATLGENLPIAADDVPALVAAARNHGVDLVVVGPEAPLIGGLVDALEEAGIPALGPHAGPATIEGSKAYAKQIMDRAGVPTAAYEVFEDAGAALAYVDHAGAPIVIKADGLAAGKGVFVAQSLAEAKEAIRACLGDGRFGEAGAAVVIEEFLDGEEASFMVLTDGDAVVPLATSRDHKRQLDGDRGPNTGGMGAISPCPGFGSELEQTVLEQIVRPTLDAIARDHGRPYRGFLYVGLMLTERGPRVLEFNARLGDPETQPLMMRLASDPVPAFMAAATGNLDGHDLTWSGEPAACVVMASGGYPGPYDKGFPIAGIEDANAAAGVHVFHAGTRREPGGTVHTHGGRVLGVTARKQTLRHTLDAAYAAVEVISWSGAQHRTDIGRGPRGA